MTHPSTTNQDPSATGRWRDIRRGIYIDTGDQARRQKLAAGVNFLSAIAPTSSLRLPQDTSALEELVDCKCLGLALVIQGRDYAHLKSKAVRATIKKELDELNLKADTRPPAPRLIPISVKIGMQVAFWLKVLGAHQ